MIRTEPDGARSDSLSSVPQQRDRGGTGRRAGLRTQRPHIRAVVLCSRAVRTDRILPHVHALSGKTNGKHFFTASRHEDLRNLATNRVSQNFLQHCEQESGRSHSPTSPLNAASPTIFRVTSLLFSP